MEKFDLYEFMEEKNIPFELAGMCHRIVYDKEREEYISIGSYGWYYPGALNFKPDDANTIVRYCNEHDFNIETFTNFCTEITSRMKATDLIRREFK